MIREFFDAPFHLDGRGRAAVCTTEDHVRDLIAAVLFTNPGERVNLPDFGCGLRQLVFAPNSQLLQSATEALAAAALDRWLSDWIIVEKLTVTSADSTLNVELTYRRRDTQEQARVQFIQ